MAFNPQYPDQGTIDKPFTPPPPGALDRVNRVPTMGMSPRNAMEAQTPVPLPIAPKQQVPGPSYGEVKAGRTAQDLVNAAQPSIVDSAGIGARQAFSAAGDQAGDLVNTLHENDLRGMALAKQAGGAAIDFARGVGNNIGGMAQKASNITGMVNPVNALIGPERMAMAGNFGSNLVGQMGDVADAYRHGGLIDAVPAFGGAIGRAAHDTANPVSPPPSAPIAPNHAAAPGTAAPATTPVTAPGIPEYLDKGRMPDGTSHVLPAGVSSERAGDQTRVNLGDGKSWMQSGDHAGMQRVIAGMQRRGGEGGQGYVAPNSGAVAGGGATDFQRNWAAADEYRAGEAAKQRQAMQDAQIQQLTAQSMNTPNPDTMSWGEFAAAKHGSHAARATLAEIAGMQKAGMQDATTRAGQQQQYAVGMGRNALTQDANALDAARLHHTRAMDAINGAKSLQDMQAQQDKADVESNYAEYYNAANQPSSFWEKVPFTNTREENAAAQFPGAKAKYYATHPQLLQQK